VILAPARDLARLPFEVLPLSANARLIDQYQIRYLSTGRDLLRLAVAPAQAPGPALVVGDPDFDLGAAPGADPVGDRVAPGTGRLRAVDHLNCTFPPLPGTRKESEQIAARLGTNPLLGAEARKAAIRAIRAPLVLHLATHGFFLSDLPSTAGGGLAQSPPVAPGSRTAHLQPAPGWENPLLRSGMALAGANIWLRGGPLPLDAEDGLLTAEDVSGLDLEGTELIVLSACETGLGQVQVGRGCWGCAAPSPWPGHAP
jgi:CHAT domain-containing protein